MALVPAEVNINAGLLGPDIMLTLQKVREGLQYYHSGYTILLIACLILVLLIILLTREIKGAARALGIIFSVSGVLSLSSALVLKQIVPGVIPADSLPARVQLWLTQVFTDIMSPWVIFSLVLLAAGAALVVISFIWHRRAAAETGDLPS